MAQKTIVRLVDDMDGSEGTHTHTIALDGRVVEIDLNDKNSAKLLKALTPFLEAGRKAKAAPGKAAPQKAKSSGSGQDTGAIRAWARENGLTVNDRGRVPAEIREAYEKANS